MSRWRRDAVICRSISAVLGACLSNRRAGWNGHRVVCEPLESRTLLTTIPFSPTQVRMAFGLGQIQTSSGGVDGTGGYNGAGETIAIVDFGSDAGIFTQAKTFSSAYNLPQFTATPVAGSPTFLIFNQGGATTPLPAVATNDEDGEEVMDVEWAHAIAPMANIDLVEATYSGNPFTQRSNYGTAIVTAAALPGVTVVSMSLAPMQFPLNDFSTSAAHAGGDVAGVTFVESSGDSGAYIDMADQEALVAPQVLSVGGTRLALNSDNSYSAESAWGNPFANPVSGSGGGYSTYPTPDYQLTYFGSTGPVGGGTKWKTNRSAPDVAWLSDDAGNNLSTAVGGDIIDTAYPTAANPGIGGGTSLTAPMWAGLIADMDTMLWQLPKNPIPSLWGYVPKSAGAAVPATALQTIPLLYLIAKSDPNAFHDMTAGNNGYPAGSGYDLATGLGSPNVPVLMQDIKTYESNIIHVVSPTTQASAGDGSSWSSPMTDLQAAINTGHENYLETGIESIIEVAQGIFHLPTDSTDTSATVQLADGVDLEGGFAGPGAADADLQSLGATTISGDGYSYHVVTASGTDKTAVIDGFTITGGDADVWGRIGFGGILCAIAA